MQEAGESSCNASVRPSMVVATSSGLGAVKRENSGETSSDTAEIQSYSTSVTHCTVCPSASVVCVTACCTALLHSNSTIGHMPRCGVFPCCDLRYLFL